MKTVLFVEQYLAMIKLWMVTLETKGKNVDALQATTAEEALMHRESSSIDVVVWGNSHLDGRPTFGESGPIAEFRRRGFTGPMIAASSVDPAREQQLASGCDHEAVSKVKVPDKIIQILGL